MGAIWAKRKADKAKKEAREKAGFHPKRIYYDEYGNLRHGWDRPKRDRQKEMEQIIETDSSMPEDGGEEKDGVEKEGKLVYAVNAPWVNAWLAFVHTLQTSPEPGPCDNSILLERDEENKCWIPIPELVLARKAKRGDYRHVTQETWKHICKLYPGSGPAIKIPNFVESNDHKNDGLYDTSDWEIDQAGFEKIEISSKKKKKEKTVESQPERASEMVPLVRPANMDVGMEDDGHKVDDRMGKFFGEKKTVESPPKVKAAPSSPIYNPLGSKTEEKRPAAAANDENDWLFS